MVASKHVPIKQLGNSKPLDLRKNELKKAKKTQKVEAITTTVSYDEAASSKNVSIKQLGDSKPLDLHKNELKKAKKTQKVEDTTPKVYYDEAVASKRVSTKELSNSKPLDLRKNELKKAKKPQKVEGTTPKLYYDEAVASKHLLQTAHDQLKEELKTSRRPYVENVFARKCSTVTAPSYAECRLCPFNDAPEEVLQHVSIRHLGLSFKCSKCGDNDFRDYAALAVHKCQKPRAQKAGTRKTLPAAIAKPTNSFEKAFLNFAHT